MNAFFAGLQSLIITVRRNAVSSAFTTMMLLILIFAWSARDNITAFIERNPSAKQESVRFDESVVIDTQVNEALNDVRTNINADRVLVRQFHNGRTDLTGLPFASVATTYFSLGPGITITEESFGSFPLSTINDVLVRMFVKGQPPKCGSLTIDEVSNPIFARYLRSNGVEMLYFCPLMNLRSQPVGYIGAGYLTKEKKRPTDDEIQLILNNSGQRIVGYLAQVTEREKKPWYETIFHFENK